MDKSEVIRIHQEYLNALNESIEHIHTNTALLKKSRESIVEQLKKQGLSSKEAAAEVGNMINHDSDDLFKLIKQLENALAELQQFQNSYE